MMVNNELPDIKLIFKYSHSMHHYKTPNKSLLYIKNKYIIEVKLLYRGYEKKRRSGTVGVSVGHHGPPSR